nr:GNAT family N-acetyltransferase [Tissierella sp.]
MQRIYETERLLLKVLDKTYAELVLEYYLRNRDFLNEWEPSRDEEFYTNTYHEQQLQEQLIDFEDGRSLRLWIFKKAEAKIIGCVSFSNIVRGSFMSCHLGYKLDKDEINRGYMTEAIKKSIDIIFSEWGLHRIEANIMPRNIASLKVAEKLEFYNEGLAYKYLKINGNWEDHIHMVLLNDKV